MSWRRSCFHPIQFPLISNQNYPQVFVAMTIANTSKVAICYHQGVSHLATEHIDSFASWRSQSRPADLGIRERASYIFGFNNLILNIYACRRLSNWAYQLFLEITDDSHGVLPNHSFARKFLASIPQALGIGSLFLLVQLLKKRHYFFALFVLFHSIISINTYKSVFHSGLLIIQTLFVLMLSWRTHAFRNL